MIRQQQQILLRKQQIFRFNSLKLLNNVDIKSWIRIRNIIEVLEVAVKVVVAGVPEDFLQDFLEDFQSVRVVGEAEFAKILR
jgi:hypothetical protein